MLKEVGTFLQSRKQSFTTSFNLDASQGVPMTEEPVTYTAAQVTAFAVDVLELCADRTDCKDMGEPSKMGRKALGKAFSATSVYSNVEKLIVVKQLNAFRRTLKSARKAARVAEAVANGTQWYADGVVHPENHELAGQPKPFPSRRKARSAYLQMTVGKDWSKQANAAQLKVDALAFVRQGAVDAPTAAETRAAASPAPAPVATQSTVSAKVTKAELVTQAVALGIAKAQAQKMKKAKLASVIDALNAL
tara:strand:- start:121 stop:867 length:747 start_codon:yes stop_codon:yes gene_type:complete